MILSSKNVLTAVGGVLGSVILARLFGKTDLGTRRQTLLAYSFAVSFVTLRLNHARFCFLPNKKGRTRGVLF